MTTSPLLQIAISDALIDFTYFQLIYILVTEGTIGSIMLSITLGVHTHQPVACPGPPPRVPFPEQCVLLILASCHSGCM